MFPTAGLTINFNGTKYFPNAFVTLGKNTDEAAIRYPIIHLKGEDIEIATLAAAVWRGIFICKRPAYHPGRNTPGCFHEAVVKTIREFYKKISMHGCAGLNRCRHLHPGSGAGV